VRTRNNSTLITRRARYGIKKDNEKMKENESQEGNMEQNGTYFAASNTRWISHMMHDLALKHPLHRYQGNREKYGPPSHMCSKHASAAVGNPG